MKRTLDDSIITFQCSKCFGNIMDRQQTMDAISKPMSVARFGDGELYLAIQGGDISFQKYSPRLSEELRYILKAGGNNLLVTLPGFIGNLEKFTDACRQFWLEFWGYYAYNVHSIIDHNYMYGDSLITRMTTDFRAADSVPGIINRFKEIWNGRDVIVVEGCRSRVGVNNDLLSGARSVGRILCPPTDAYAKADDIYGDCMKHGGVGKLFLLALGPTATVLAYRLSLAGMTALDIGHLDIQYEHYLRGYKSIAPIPGKHVGEAHSDGGDAPMPDEYYSQIL